MIKRIGKKLDSKIPISQAAYRSGRSTTEHVFTCKILAEKATTSTDFEIHFLLLDMSKAFDSIIRSELVKDLSEILNNDELHLIGILLGTELVVQVGNPRSLSFKTDTGAPQGDCMSGIEFTYYLARPLKEKSNDEHNVNEHNYCKETQIEILNEKNEYEKEPIDYNQKVLEKKNACNFVDINMEYAEDMTEVTRDKKIIDHIKVTNPPILEKRGLKINETKTEEYTVKYKGEEEWKDAKVFGIQIRHWK